MWYEGYHKKKFFWSYHDILNIDYYLIDIQKSLSKINLKENIKILHEYRVRSKTNPMILVFENYMLEVQGIDEITAVIRGLEYVYETIN